MKRLNSYFKRLWRQPRPFVWWRFWAWLYGGALFLRRLAYKKGWFKSRASELPVISVGNLVVGGAGKTPLVIWLACFFLNRGMKPAVLSRGYGRSPGPDELVVSLGGGPLVRPVESGDEPWLIAHKAAGALVLVGPRRAALARRARRLGADILIMDDGFQHLALKRDLDLVVFKTANPWGNGRTMPAGPLREPWSALKAADALIFTGAPEAEPARPEAWPPDKPVFQFFYRVDRLYRWADGVDQPREKWPRLAVAAFCGLGEPGGFYATLKEAGLTVAGVRSWPDHHQYEDRELRALIDWAEHLGVEFVAATEKDAVKIEPGHPISRRLLVVSLAADWRDEAGFTAWLTGRLKPGPFYKSRHLQPPDQV